eukprot:s190_g22.t1
MHHGQVPPNIHLAELNPHMDLEDVNMNFPTESAVELSRTKCSFGVSSFGFGGTNSHVAGLAPPASAEVQPVEEKMKFNRQRFSWSRAKHPFSAPRQGGEHGGSVFAAPINGKVLKLLSHHIVHGEIVVPGATYIEMVIAISALRFGMMGKRFALENIGFQNPLVLRPIDDKESQASARARVEGGAGSSFFEEQAVV